MNNKDKLLLWLYKDMEANKGDYDKICQLIEQYIGHLFRHRQDTEIAAEEALELYQELKEAAFDAGYITKTTKVWDNDNT